MAISAATQQLMNESAAIQSGHVNQAVASSAAYTAPSVNNVKPPTSPTTISTSAPAPVSAPITSGGSNAGMSNTYTPAPTPTPRPAATTPVVTSQPTSNTGVPFKAGLTPAQQSSITNLMSAQSSDTWNATDIANWNYATNNAPRPPATTSTQTTPTNPIAGLVDSANNPVDGTGALRAAATDVTANAAAHNTDMGAYNTAYQALMASAQQTPLYSQTPAGNASAAQQTGAYNQLAGATNGQFTPQQQQFINNQVSSAWAQYQTAIQQAGLQGQQGSAKALVNAGQHGGLMNTQVAGGTANAPVIDPQTGLPSNIGFGAQTGGSLQDIKSQYDIAIQNAQRNQQMAMISAQAAAMEYERTGDAALLDQSKSLYAQGQQFSQDAITLANNKVTNLNAWTGQNQQIQGQQVALNQQQAEQFAGANVAIKDGQIQMPTAAQIAQFSQASGIPVNQIQASVNQQYQSLAAGTLVPAGNSFINKFTGQTIAAGMRMTPDQVASSANALYAGGSNPSYPTYQSAFDAVQSYADGQSTGIGSSPAGGASGSTGTSGATGNKPAVDSAKYTNALQSLPLDQKTKNETYLPGLTAALQKGDVNAANSILQQAAKQSLPTSASSDFTARDGLMKQVLTIADDLTKYYNSGAKTGFAEGSAEKAYELVGKNLNPEAARINAEINTAISTYRTANNENRFTLPIVEFVEGNLPSLSNDKSTNESKINGILSAMNTSMNGLMKNNLPASFDTIFPNGVNPDFKPVSFSSSSGPSSLDKIDFGPLG